MAAWWTVGCEPATTTPGGDGGVDATQVVDATPRDALGDAQATPDRVDAGADLVATDVVEAPDASDAAVRCPRLGDEPAERSGGICDATNVIDLNAMGAPDRSYVGWVDAPVRPRARCLVDYCFTSGTTDLLRQVAHRYRMRTTARLRATTNLLGTFCGPEGHADTFVAIVLACDTTRDTDRNVVACTDGDLPAVGAPGTAVSPEVIPAGTEVFVVVGTVARATPVEPIAPYELGLSEVPEARVDASCSPAANPEAAGPAGECPAGYHCVAPTDFSTRGHCVAYGTAPNARCRHRVAVDGGVDGGADGGADGGVAPCDPGLVCGNFNYPDGVCLRLLEYGDECSDQGDTCRRVTYWSCVVTDPADPSRGTCVLPGSAPGAVCSTGGIDCVDGLQCSGDRLSSSCRSTVARGATCDPEARTSVCESGASCAPTSTGDRFVCRTDGTVAGSACRAADPRCDDGLTCSDASGPGICRETLAAGATSCDPRYASQRCADGLVCLATGHRTGRCVTPVGEGADTNDHPRLATPVSLPAAVRGSISTAGDVDCVAFDVPAHATLRAETSDGAGGCPARIDTVITLHDPEGRVIDGSDDYQKGHRYCSGFDGAWRNSQARDLPAGRYTVCVWAFQAATPIGPYVLSVTATTP